MFVVPFTIKPKNIIMKSSVKQRIQCFQDNLPKFLSQQKEYLANRKKGVRPAKNK